MLSAITMFILLLVYYVALIQDMADINGTKLEFYVANSCSDLTLNTAFSHLLKDQSTMNTQAIVGFVISILALIVHLSSMLAAFGLCGKDSHSGKKEDKDSYGTFNKDGSYQEISKEHGGDYKHNF